LAAAAAIVWSPGAVVAGALVGAAQWVALRRRGRISPWWIPATSVSLPLAGWLFFTVGMDAVGILERAVPGVRTVAGGDTLVPFLLLPLSVGAAVGAAVGLAQASSVRAPTAPTLAWSLWNAAAGALVLPFAFVGAYAVADAYEYEAYARSNHLPGDVGMIAAGALAGAAYGAIASGGLRPLLRPAGTGMLDQRVERIRIGSRRPKRVDLLTAGMALVMVAMAWQVVRPKHLPSDVHVVYLADPTQPRLPPAEMRAAGVVVVGDVEALLAAAHTADAIVLDRSRLRELPPGWLMEQSNRGRIIVGTNVANDELRQYTDRNPPRPPAAGWREVPSTFTAQWRLPADQRSSLGAGYARNEPVRSGWQVALFVADMVHEVRASLGHGPYMCRPVNDCGPYARD